MSAEDQIILQPGVDVEHCRFDHCRDRTSPCTDHPAPPPEPAGAPEILDDLADLEQLPDKKLPNIFRCSQGHTQLGPCETKVINRWNQQVDLRTGPICLKCWFDWLGEIFPSKDTGVQAEITIDKGD